MLLVRASPFALAVTVAVCVLVTAAAEAVNVVDIEPAGTVTEAGTVKLALLLEIDTVNPPIPAASDNPTVHVEVAGVFTGDVHERLLRATGGITVTDAPVPVEGITAASAEEAIAPLTPIEIEFVVGAAATVNVAVATTPLAIAVVFTPKTMHVTVPGEEALHETDFPAAVPTGPIATETLAISEEL
jgi:hypothetical protein